VISNTRTYSSAARPSDPASSISAGITAAAARDPHGPALRDGRRTLSFRDLDRTTSALAVLFAGRLRPDDHSGAGVGAVPGGAPVPVGLMVDHGAEGVVAALGLTRAGRLFVMLDPYLPEARLAHVIQLAGITEIAADAAHVAQAAPLVAEGAVLAVEPLLDGARAIAAGDDMIEPVLAAQAPGDRDPFDIIFTSGSTGAPKGVVITHRQALVDAANVGAVFGLGPGDRVASVLPHGFAAGIMLVLAGIMAGACVVFVDPRERGLDGLLRWVVDEDITTLHCTPHLLRSIAAAVAPEDTVLHGLRMVATVGEAVTGPDVTAIRPLLSGTASFWNWTGSTETTAFAFHEIRPSDPIPQGGLPSGFVAPHKVVRILRIDGTAADVGETGELLCVSDAMTSGYWGAPEQTAARAGVDPDGTPTWRQGDLARLDADGTVTLLGRADDAVKVRGYLVEPSEVEAAIRQIGAIQETAVIAVKSPPAPTRLVAYVVARSGRRSPSPAAIRRELREMLPDYMVPTSIVLMVALPRNERGKVDRARLPEAPPLGGSVGADGTELTMSELTHDQWELAVGQIWAEVLGLPAVGVEDDFSALGGDSLAAEEMLAAVQERIGVELRSTELLEHPTLGEFAGRVRAGSAAVRSHPDVVRLRSASDEAEDAPARPPVFCISGAGALGLTFLPLARRFGGRDVYAFQQHGLERRGLPDRSIRAMADRYLELIRVVRPHGPYVIVGHSLGGLVALEVARALAASGEPVDHVVLLDTYLPRSASEQGVLEFARLQEPEQTGRSRIAAAVRHAAERQVRKVLPGGLAQFRRVGRRIRSIGAGVIRYQGQRQFDALFDHATRVAKGHALQPYEGRVTFVVAEGNPDGVAAWADILVGPVERTRLDSEHSSLLREPNVADLARLLLAAIDEECDGRARSQSEPDQPAQNAR